MGWLQGWSYRREITVTNGGSLLTDYELPVNLSSSNFDFIFAKPDGADLRFALADGTSVLDYWIEDYDDTGQSARIWVRVPSLPAGDTTIYIYYGNGLAEAMSNAHLTFLFADDFQLGWVKEASNPVLDRGAGGQWDDGFIGEPEVIYQPNAPASERFAMLYFGYDGNARTGLAYSPDGVAWTKFAGNPILDVGPSSYDNLHAHKTSVVLKDGTYYMFYCAVRASDGQRTIALATATDLEGPWTKYGSNPILAPTLGFEDDNLETPSAIYDAEEGIWKLWYAAGRQANQEPENWNYATAPAAEGPWTKHGSNPIAVGVGQWMANLGGLHVIKREGRYLNFFNAFNAGGKSHIGLMSSHDGITWNVQPGSKILDTGAGGSWDDINAWRPHVVEVDGEWWVYYNGNGAYERIGFARLETPGTSFSNGKWARHIESGSIEVSGGLLVIDDDNDAAGGLYSGLLSLNYQVPDDTILETRGRVTSSLTNAANAFPGIISDLPFWPAAKWQLILAIAEGTDRVVQQSRDNGFGGEDSMLGAYLTLNTWYRPIIKKRPGADMDFILRNDSEAQVGTSVLGSTDLPSGLFGGVTVDARASRMEVDWVRLRQLVATEPSLAIGAAEAFGVLDTLSLLADLDKDGVFETDWSSYLYAIQDVGLQREDAVSRFPPRRATLVLDNEDSRFSPRNASSPYYPSMKAGARIQLSTTIEAPAVENLLRNPSAETDTAFWTNDGLASFDRREDIARFGRYGLEITSTGAGSVIARQNAAGTASVATYTASVYVRGVGVTIGKSITVLIVEGTTARGSTGVTLGSHMQRVSVSGSLLGTGAPGIQLFWSADASDEIVVLDGCQIEKVSAVTPYCDGDQPGCSWQGTAHASISERPENPSFPLFTGELRRPSFQRWDTPTATFEATGISETILSVPISAGPFSRKPARLVAQRLLDVIEAEVAERILGLTGEAVRDPVVRFSGNTWGMNSGTETTKDTGTAGNDPVVFEAVEGDNVHEFVATGAGALEGSITVTALSANNPHRVSIFLQARNAAAANKTVRMTLGPAPGVDIVMGNIGEWVYGSFVKEDIGVTLPPVYKLTGIDLAADAVFWADGLHVSPSFAALGILGSPQFLGTSWDEEIEYLDAFQRPAGAVLDELAASVGGWIYEDGDGSLVFEDYTRRDPAVVSVPALRLSDTPFDGLGHNPERYEEPATSLAGSVRAISLGDVTPSPGPDAEAKIAWNLEPGGIALANNEQRLFFATYLNEGEGSLIARRAVARALPLTGWGVDDGIQTPYLLNYGRGGDVYIKEDAASTVLRLFVICRPAFRQDTERSIVTVGGDDPVIDLEMPAQGAATQLMQDVAQWAYDKYSAGPALVGSRIAGLDFERLSWIFGARIGDAVWLRHMLGIGAFYLDGLFYIEGVAVSWDAREPSYPTVLLTLEEAPGA